MQPEVKRSTIYEEEKEDEVSILKKSTLNNVARDEYNQNSQTQRSMFASKNKIAHYNCAEPAAGEQRAKEIS